MGSTANRVKTARKLAQNNQARTSHARPTLSVLMGSTATIVIVLAVVSAQSIQVKVKSVTIITALRGFTAAIVTFVSNFLALVKSVTTGIVLKALCAGGRQTKSTRAGTRSGRKVSTASNPMESRVKKASSVIPQEMCALTESVYMMMNVNTQQTPLQ